MREIVDFSGINLVEHGPDVIRLLTRVHPEGLRANGWWGIKLQRNDPRIVESMNILAHHGFIPWINHDRQMVKGHEYSILIWREYDESDFADSRLLRFCGGSWASSSPTRKDGCLRIYLPAKDERRFEFDFSADALSTGDGHDNSVILSDRVKHLLESAGFTDARFRPTFVVPPRSNSKEDNEHITLPWDGFGEPWWELHSELTLPRMSSRAFLVNSKGQRVLDDFSEGCVIKEGIDNLDAVIMAMEPKYLKSDIDALGEFDVAQTFEWFGPRAPYLGRLIIVSKRFYRFCREQNLKVNFVPVRVHD